MRFLRRFLPAKPVILECCQDCGDIHFRCPTCASLNMNGPFLDDLFADKGGIVRCPDCGQRTVIPGLAFTEADHE